MNFDDTLDPSYAYIPYVAYGSNMNLDQMNYRCPDAVLVGRGTLPDWRLVFRNVADIEPVEGRMTPITSWLVSKDDLDALDAYEGYPSLYYRRMVKFRHDDDREDWALTYVMTSRESYGEPSPGYYESIACGYRSIGHSRDKLRNARKHARRNDMYRGRSPIARYARGFRT